MVVAVSVFAPLSVTCAETEIISEVRFKDDAMISSNRTQVISR